MTPNQYPNVSRCPSRCPSKHTREERAKSVFVSGVPVGSALGGLDEFGREHPAVPAGRRFMRALRVVLRQLGPILQQPRWKRSNEKTKPLIYQMY